MSRKFNQFVATLMFWGGIVAVALPFFCAYTLKQWVQLELTALWLLIVSVLFRLDMIGDDLGTLFSRVSKNNRKISSIDEDVEHLFETLLPDYVPTTDYTAFAANVEVSTPELRA